MIYKSTCLEELKIESCRSLKSLVRGQLPPTLKRLVVDSCPELRSLSPGGNLPARLQHLEIVDCFELKSIAGRFGNNTFLNGGLATACLIKLQMHSCERLEALPGNIHNLLSLHQLEIFNCPGIVSFPKQGFPTNLKTLRIYSPVICKVLFEWGLHKFASLTELSIKGGYPSMMCFPEDEMGMILPTSLAKLHIRDFPKLEYLSIKGFQNLTSLEYLSLQAWPRLASFPSNGLSPSLLKLFIKDCPLLKQRCQTGKGQEWLKIAYIPSVGIDERPVFDPELEFEALL
ncbi:hypothetical protein GH714_004212 [Hevea brasiliensis]|uniref:Uncharacterized protein n=1 Tax=Hevea brasiliensis TaxID=3981 RepID=A0A6A6KXE8_HEVBR|nr:hypothetical protein GH714_004212 [Hevea brasiliensis]